MMERAYMITMSFSPVGWVEWLTDEEYDLLLLDLEAGGRGVIDLQPMETYHLIQSGGDEWLTRCDTTAELAKIEGLDVLFNVGLGEVAWHIQFHDTPDQLRVL